MKIAQFTEFLQSAQCLGSSPVSLSIHIPACHNDKPFACIKCSQVKTEHAASLWLNRNTIMCLSLPLCPFYIDGCWSNTFPCSWPEQWSQLLPPEPEHSLFIHCENEPGGRALKWPIQMKALPTQSVNTWAHHEAGPVPRVSKNPLCQVKSLLAGRKQCPKDH